MRAEATCSDMPTLSNVYWRCQQVQRILGEGTFLSISIGETCPTNLLLLIWSVYQKIMYFLTITFMHTFGAYYFKSWKMYWRRFIWRSSWVDYIIWTDASKEGTNQGHIVFKRELKLSIFVWMSYNTELLIFPLHFTCFVS